MKTNLSWRLALCGAVAFLTHSTSGQTWKTMDDFQHMPGNSTLARDATVDPAGNQLAAIESQTAPATQVPPTRILVGRPLSFEPRARQGDGPAQFTARGPGYSLSVAPAEAELLLFRPEASAPGERRTGKGLSSRSSTTIRMRLAGANPQSVVAGEGQLPGKANYFTGAKPNQWRTNVPTFAKVRCANVYRGVDLVYYGNQRQLEFDFVVAPGANPKGIALSFEGADKIELAADGDLVLHAGGAEVRQHKPLIYQTINGVRQQIAGGYKLGKGRVSFEVAAYDRTQPLVIDPTLVYSTYFGGSYGDGIADIAVDKSGNFYVVGNSLWILPDGSDYGQNMFVAKFRPDATLVYSTYFPFGPRGNSIAVDDVGNAYITGWTMGFLLTTPGAFQTSGGPGAFVTKLSSDGATLIYSTFLCRAGSELYGASTEDGTSIAVDASGSAYVCGRTTSPDFPVTANALQSSYGGIGSQGFSGGSHGDAFVAKLNPSGSALVYSTYLGGDDDDVAFGITLDGSGNACVVGLTLSANFPTTANAFQKGLAAPTGNGENYSDLFVTKLNADGSALLFSTYLGGSGREYFDVGSAGARAIALDSTGNVYVTGITESPDFPTTNALLSIPGFAFVSKLTPDGSSLLYSTYFSCGAYANPSGIAVDPAGNAYVTGATGGGPGFSILNAIQPNYPGSSWGAFVAKIASDGSRVLYSTYLSGKATGFYWSDIGTSIAVDGVGNAYVAGYTWSTDFPTTADAFQPSLADVSVQLPQMGNHGGDGFISIIHSENEPPPPPPTITIWPPSPSDYSVPNEPGQCTGKFTYWASAQSSIPCVQVVCDPPAGTDLHLPVGTTAVHVIARDALGGSNYQAFNVTVVDTEPPTITCPANMIVSTDPGQCSAVVNYTVAASHNCGSDAKLVSSPPSGSVFPKGTTTVNCTAINSSGKQASCSFTVTVNDTEKPVIHCPANIAVNVPCGQSSAVVTYPAPSATDNCSAVTVSCTPPSGSTFPAGTTTVHCTATDSSGNTALCAFDVTVNASIFAFTGFLSPIGGADATGGSFANPLRTFKLNSTIPVKFTVGCGGAPVLAGVHRLQVIQYSGETTAADPIDATPTDAATTGDQFRLTGGQWQFNLDTKATGMSVGIWLMRATLSDGSQHSAWIQIK